MISEDDELNHEIGLREVFNHRGKITPKSLIYLDEFDVSRIENIINKNDDLFDFGFEHFESVFFEYKI